MITANLNNILTKRFLFFLVSVSLFADVYSQENTYKGVMQVNNITRQDIIVKTVEKENKISGTIYKMRVVKHLDLTVDVSIEALNLTQKDGKKYINGKNTVPTVNNKRIDKIKVKQFDGVIINDELQFTLTFADKTMHYKGKRIK